jgi:hypothetical protein
MRKQLCACGCGNMVTRKVESQHMNALAPAFLASQVFDQNRRSIQQKKRSKATKFPPPFRQRPAMQNTTDIHMHIDDNDGDHVSHNSAIMMGEDFEKPYGQSKLFCQFDEDFYMNHAVLPDFLDEDDIYMDHPDPGPSALSHDEGLCSHNSQSPIMMDEAYGQSILFTYLVKLMRILI